MMRLHTVSILGTFALSLGAAHLEAAPISASMYLRAFAQNGSATATDTDSDSWGVLLSPLSVAAVATVPGVTAQGSGQATWLVGGNAGAVSFKNYGWETLNVQSGAAYLTGASAGDLDWRYSFSADADGSFTMDYGVIGIGDRFGLQGWNIVWSGPGGGLTLVNASNPSTSGTFTRAVVGGDTYTVGLKTEASISGGLGTRAASMDGEFAWQLVPEATPVPEPSSLMLLVSGVVAAQRFAARRKRSR